MSDLGPRESIEFLQALLAGATVFDRKDPAQAAKVEAACRSLEELMAITRVVPELEKSGSGLARIEGAIVTEGEGLLAKIGVGISGQEWSGYLIGVLMALALLFCLGLLIERGLNTWLVWLVDAVVGRIPVVRTIYDGRFQGRCRLTSWAASIASHVGLNAIRSRKTERGIFERGEPLESPNLAYGASNPEAMLEARDSLRKLREALATLSPGRAEAVLLHDALGYNLSEVAAMTSSSEAAVQSRLVRGRRDLEERLEITPKTNPKGREG